MTMTIMMMMMRMNEDMEDMYLRAGGEVLEEKEVVAARLLDLRPCGGCFKDMVWMGIS